MGTRLGVKRKHTTSRKEEREPHPGETSQLSENSPPAQRLLPVRGGSVAHAALRAETPGPRGEATLCSLGVDFTPPHVADPAGGQAHPRASALTSLRPEGEDPRRPTKGCLTCGGARRGARGCNGRDRGAPARCLSCSERHWVAMVYSSRLRPGPFASDGSTPMSVGCGLSQWEEGGLRGTLRTVPQEGPTSPLLPGGETRGSGPACGPGGGRARRGAQALPLL